MTPLSPARIEPSKHATAFVDEKLRRVERQVDAMPSAGSPAIKPNTALGENALPENDTLETERA